MFISQARVRPIRCFLVAASVVVTSCTAADDASTDVDPIEPDFETAQVSFDAEQVEIRAADRVFFPTGDVVVSGWRDPANEATQMDLSWQQHDVEMRLSMSFASDGEEWWADQIRTYDGRSPGEWVSQPGPFFRTPLGAAFEGDESIGGIDIKGLTLLAFTEPAECGQPTAPVELVALNHEIQGWAAPGNGTSVAVMAIDTASCQPVTSLDSFAFDVRSEGRNVVEPRLPMRVVRPGVASAELAIRGSGETTIVVVASDVATGALVDEVRIPVAIRANPEPGSFPTTTGGAG